MREGLHEPVSVLAGYSHKDKKFRPLMVTWQRVDYRMGTIDFHHATKQGVTTLHHFSLADVHEQIYMKLLFDTATLQWTLEEYQMEGRSAVTY